MPGVHAPRSPTHLAGWPQHVNQFDTSLRCEAPIQEMYAHDLVMLKGFKRSLGYVFSGPNSMFTRNWRLSPNGGLLLPKLAKQMHRLCRQSAVGDVLSVIFVMWLYLLTLWVFLGQLYKAIDEECTPINVCRDCSPPAGNILSCRAVPGYTAHSVSEYGEISGEVNMVSSLTVFWQC